MASTKDQGSLLYKLWLKKRTPEKENKFGQNQLLTFEKPNISM